MITLRDLSGALCAKPGADPLLWDPDTHNHLKLGPNACWLCEEAVEVCWECPVLGACFEQAQEVRESFTIRAGMAWTNGRPRDVHRRRTRS